MAEWERRVPNINNRSRGRTVRARVCVCIYACIHVCALPLGVSLISTHFLSAKAIFTFLLFIILLFQ